MTTKGRTHHCEDAYNCAICPKSSKRKKQIDAPCDTLRNDYKCDVCHKKFISKHGMFGHMQVHVSTADHQCMICNKNFKRRCVMLCHLKTHTSGDKSKIDDEIKAPKRVKTRPAETDSDGEFRETRFKSAHVSNGGEKIDKGCNEVVFVCEICNKKFAKMRSLISHVRVHSSKKIYECEICNKRFPTMRSLTGHMQVHSSKKIYECELCQKTFKWKHIYLHHMQTCGKPNCDKVETWNDMNLEMRAEDDDDRSKIRNPKCHICGKIFKSRIGLYGHMRVHGEKMRETVSHRDLDHMNAVDSEGKTIDETNSVQLYSRKQGIKIDRLQGKLIPNGCNAIEELSEHANAFDDPLEINLSTNQNVDSPHEVVVKVEVTEIFDVGQVLKREAPNEEQSPNGFVVKTEETGIASLGDAHFPKSKSSLTNNSSSASNLEHLFYNIMNQISDYVNGSSKTVVTDHVDDVPDTK